MPIIKDKTLAPSWMAQTPPFKSGASSVPSSSWRTSSMQSGNGGRESPRLNQPAVHPEFTVRMVFQMGRVEMLVEALESLPENASECTLAELDDRIREVEDLHKEFLSEHRVFEVTYPSILVDHEYVRNQVYLKTCRNYTSFRRAALKLRSCLVPQERPAGHSPEPRLPDIALPHFKGDYAQWPSFSKVFKSLIFENSSLKDVDRLHYLRGCLEGTPAHLISTLPFTGASLKTAWDLLTAKYENKRLHIQSHLDSIFNLEPLTAKSATGLEKIVSTVSEAHSALRSLEMDQNIGECILVHHISRLLDPATREAWETSLGSSQEYPSFEQLETFLTSRRRSPDKVENANPAQQNKSRGQQKKSAAANQASASAQATAAADSTKYPCDCCNGDHFIVMCSIFRASSAHERRQLAIDKHLCFNCLGRHNARMCRSKQGCKECSARHHTMMHDASVAATQPKEAPAKTNSSWRH